MSRQTWPAPSLDWNGFRAWPWRSMQPQRPPSYQECSSCEVNLQWMHTSARPSSNGKAPSNRGGMTNARLRLMKPILSPTGDLARPSANGSAQLSIAMTGSQAAVPAEVVPTAGTAGTTNVDACEAVPVEVQRETMLAFQVDLAGRVRPGAMLKLKDIALGLRRIGAAQVGVGRLARLGPRRSGQYDPGCEPADQRHPIGDHHRHASFPAYAC